jgi:HEAT repeat protein
MLDALLRRLREPDGLVRADAMNALRALSDPGKLDGLAAVARDPQAHELGRSFAISLIEEEQGAAPSEVLVAIAGDASVPEDTRARAIAALSRRDAARFDAVADALAADRSAVVRAAVTSYAERLPAAHAEALCRAALSDPSRWVRSATCYPIEHYRLAALAPLIVDAFQRIEQRQRAENPNFTFWDRRDEENALVRALAGCIAAPGLAAITAPVRKQLQEFASDPDNDDREQSIFLYTYARNVLGIK